MPKNRRGLKDGGNRIEVYVLFGRPSGHAGQA